ncbi:N-formylglutamate amidohydrolase [Spartinivicinus ruber]|uniref:N-formylglutamate amidohydrolase n=1 Tax=Spartinivicinus ruber TaxID=2683272 RepID=UPI0013CFFC24|nr:N-formylglutamate amidohydrolase [Spartinivicinus ruber]
MPTLVTENQPYTLLKPGELKLPILISVPHCGTLLTKDFTESVADTDILNLPDTDWFVNELYDFAIPLGIPLIHAVYSRYVIDLNRQLPGEKSLYTKKSRVTELVPLYSFDGRPIYKEGMEPSESEISRRVEKYYHPYYQKISQVLTALRQQFPLVMLYDGHSIKGQVKSIQSAPFADYMPANRQGVTCPNEFIQCAEDIIRSHHCTYSSNGPFQGGNITRHFCNHQSGIISFQMEISQRLYMDETTGEKIPLVWKKTTKVLQEIVENFTEILLAMNKGI